MACRGAGVVARGGGSIIEGIVGGRVEGEGGRGDIGVGRCVRGLAGRWGVVAAVEERGRLAVIVVGGGTTVAVIVGGRVDGEGVGDGGSDDTW